MEIDWFGFKKRKEILKREINTLINGEEAESAANLQGWDVTDQTEGRNTKVSYRTLEQVYKKESWVRAGIDAIQRTATSNGFRLVTEDENDPNDLTEKETSRIMKLLKTPNAEDSFSDIISEIVVDLHLYGDAYIEIVKDDKGIPIAIYNIYAPSIKVLVNRHGTILGYIQNVDSAKVRTGQSEAVVFDPEELVHFKLPNPGNEVYGLSPIESLFIPIEADLHAQAYNLTFFKNNATPKLHIDLGNCTLPQLKRTKEFFKKEYLGNPHKTLITEGGVKVTPIGTKPAEMEFLNLRKFSRDEILAVLGVPPMKVGITEDVNRASALEADKSFKSDKIIPLQRMLAKKINLCIISLFTEAKRVRLEFAELDLRDAKEQAIIDKFNIESGVMTVNEARKKRGLPPLPPRKISEEVPEVEIEESLNFLNEKILEPENGKSKRELSLYFS